MIFRFPYFRRAYWRRIRAAVIRTVDERERGNMAGMSRRDAAREAWRQLDEEDRNRRR
jgi:hypothetical protein